jgi:ketosteroid isomerase-like protein
MSQDAPKGEVAVEEQVAIRDLLERYCRYIDDCSSSKIADLFTEDAVLEAMGRRLVGRNEIVAFLPAEPGVVRERPVTQHLLSNVVIERSGQDLRAESDWAMLRRNQEGGVDVVLAGRFRDRLSRDERGRWRIGERNVVALTRMGR